MESSRILEIMDFIVKKQKVLGEALNLYDSDNSELLFAAVERLSEEILGSLFKINDLLLDCKGEIPGSYRDGFLDVGRFYSEIGVDFSVSISKFASFRNNLAHEYMDLDSSEVIVFCNSMLPLVSEYLKRISLVISN